MLGVEPTPHNGMGKLQIFEAYPIHIKKQLNLGLQNLTRWLAGAEP